MANVDNINTTNTNNYNTNNTNNTNTTNINTTINNTNNTTNNTNNTNTTNTNTTINNTDHNENKKIGFLFGKIQGHSCLEIVSALQKAIRRNQISAYHWARLLWQHGFANGAFLRLQLIASEDVGSDLSLPLFISQEYDKVKKQRPLTLTIWRDHLFTCIWKMMETPRTRRINNIACQSRHNIFDKYGPITTPTTPITTPTPTTTSTSTSTNSPPSAFCSFEQLQTILIDHSNGSNSHSFTDTTEILNIVELAMIILIWESKKVGVVTKKMWELFKEVGKKRKESIVLKIICALESFFRAKPSDLFIIHALLVLIEGVCINDNNTDNNVPTDWSKELDQPLDMLIPPEAIDKHTMEGKRQGKGILHFLTEGALVYDRKINALAISDSLFPDIYATANQKWYLELEAATNRQLFPFPKSTKIKAFLLKIWEEKQCNENKENQKKGKKRKETETDIKTNTPAKKRKIKKKEINVDVGVGTGVDVGVDVGMGVETKDEKHDNHSKLNSKMKSIFDLSYFETFAKDITFDPMDPVHLKNSIFTQLPCGSKCPALIGEWSCLGDVWDNKKVFIKGPLKREHVLNQLACTKTKECIGSEYLHVIPTRALKRQNLWYILMIDISQGWTIGKKHWNKTNQDISVLVSGKNENDSRIFADYLKRFENNQNIPEEMKKQYLAALLFRTWLGVSDTNHRNLLVANNQLFSVDETVTGRLNQYDHIPFRVDHVSNDFKKVLSSWIKTYKLECNKWMNDWMSKTDLLHFSREIERVEIS